MDGTHGTPSFSFTRRKSEYFFEGCGSDARVSPGHPCHRRDLRPDRPRRRHAAHGGRPRDPRLPGRLRRPLALRGRAPTPRRGPPPRASGRGRRRSRPRPRRRARAGAALGGEPRFRRIRRGLDRPRRDPDSARRPFHLVEEGAVPHGRPPRRGCPLLGHGHPRHGLGRRLPESLERGKLPHARMSLSRIPTTFASYVSLTKPRITVFVVMTAFVGFVAGTNGPLSSLALPLLLHTLLGTALVASGTSAFNQVREVDLDGLMKRTQDRPYRPGASASAARPFSRARSRWWD